MESSRLGVVFKYSETVIEIKMPYFKVITESAEDKSRHRYHGKNMILAAGGCASPQLGSNGSGYELAKTLGHNIIKPLPALVQLKSPDKYCKTVSGVRANALVTAFDKEKELGMEEGEIIFTDYGISGIPIMQLSRFVAKSLDRGKNCWLSLDFIKDRTKEEVKSILKCRIHQNPNKSLEEMMIGLFNHKLNYILIKEAKLDPTIPSIKVTERDIDILTQQIKNLRLQINSTNSFENAQVCCGGVKTGEIDSATMESKLVRKLYLAGELVDVDGTCGGYNLQWAWSSGYLAGTTAGCVDRI
jgi:predicted Rossmann fold flavoprotein